MIENPEFIILRVYNVPRGTLWEAWTVPDIMAKWWGPKGFIVGKYTMDLRPGGTYHYSMKSPDGSEMWGKFVYKEVTKPEKLVFVNSFSDAQCDITRHPFSPTWPLETLSTMLFSEENGKAKITIKWSPINASEEEIKTFADGMASMQQGWTGTLDQLEEYLSNH
jgi:uncharacterized protein YndB with AHSA1/START domain